MPLVIENSTFRDWQLRKIGVIGPGIVGMPMAAMLADARIREGTHEPAKVVVVQRDSPTSGWKIDAINSGVSTIRGIEPELASIVSSAVDEGLLSATHEYAELHDADMVLVCVQTDRNGLGPDYGPLVSSLEALAVALQGKPNGNIPLVAIESTLAPSTMTTLIRDLFASHGLLDGRQILLGFSPNRVMPGRLVERIRTSDKLVSGLTPITAGLIRTVYSKIVTAGTVFETNTLTAEVEKTAENAYRDVRIAYAAEIVRFCDKTDVDFFQLRDAVNRKLEQTDLASGDSSVVPSGGLLVPTVGVGGHCLPKDGILLWWRRRENGDRSQSMIEQARKINDASPSWTVGLTESIVGDLKGRNIAVLGAAYRFNSEDTRNSPSLVFAKQLLEKGAHVRIHDPYVGREDQNLKKLGLQEHFTNDLILAAKDVDVLIACTGHQDYIEASRVIAAATTGRLNAVVDACNLWRRHDFDSSIRYTGIGRGTEPPGEELVDFVTRGFRIVEHGFARELNDTISFLNSRYAHDNFSRISYREVQRLAATCSTGCRLVDPIYTEDLRPFQGFLPTLVELAQPKAICASTSSST